MWNASELNDLAEVTELACDRIHTCHNLGTQVLGIATLSVKLDCAGTSVV